MLDHIASLDPEQRRRGRQICFWALLAYLEFWWLGSAALAPLVIALLLAAGLYAIRNSAVGQRPTFVVLHGVLLVAMLASILRAERPSTPLIVDLAVLGGLFVFELGHRRPVLLLAIAAEHLIALAMNPWCAFARMSDPYVPEAGAAALARIFAVFAVLSISFRVHLLPRLRHFDPDHEPPEEPVRPPGRALTVAEWEARNPPK